MNVQNNFGNFKSYDYYKSLTISKNQKKSKIDKKNVIALVGSTVGVATGMLATKNIRKKPNKNILEELAVLLSMMGGANVGSIIASSIGKKPKEIRKKIHEGAFQIMNAAIPMLMVGAANGICNKTIGKTKPIIRALASVAAVVSGATIATKITNATNTEKEPPRKYTIKDSVAHIDDAVVTFSFGFDDVAEKLKLDTRLMPFIYAYCGMRAGAKD